MWLRLAAVAFACIVFGAGYTAAAWRGQRDVVRVELRHAEAQQFAYRAAVEAVARHRAEVGRLRGVPVKRLRVCPDPMPAGAAGAGGFAAGPGADIGPAVRACYEQLLQFRRLHESQQNGG